MQRRADNSSDQGPFGARLRHALRDTKITWYPIPVGLGIGFLGFAQLYRVRQREKLRQEEEDEKKDDGSGGRPRRRKRIRPDGPW